MRILCALTLASVVLAQRPEPARERIPLLARWEGLRYGMFIHFGMSTFTGDEFGKLPARSDAYAPTSLDVEQWVLTAKQAGMRYAVLTAKHCYGHCLWDSKFSDYDVASSKCPIDVVQAFTEACKKHDIAPGLYYLLGWDERNQARMRPPTYVEYETFVKAQLTELLTRYGKLTELWLDIPFDLGTDASGAWRRIYERVKQLQPECLVLFNQGFTDGEQIVSAAPTWRHVQLDAKAVSLWPNDILNGERTLPPEKGHTTRHELGGQTFYLPMEVCDTLARSWFWVEGETLKPVRVLHKLYQQTTSRGANLLLDVAPDRTGRIPAASVQRLIELRRAIEDPKLLPASLLDGAAASASNVYHGDEHWGASRAIDEDPSTRWATDDELTSATLEVVLGAERELAGAFVREGFDRVRAFTIEIEEGGAWRTVHEGTAIGERGLTVKFAKTRTKKLRLVIKEASKGPTIWDFEPR